MEKNKLSIQEIATTFSIGNFEITHPYLSESVTCKIINESEIKGKSTVVATSKKTAEYFNFVQTTYQQKRNHKPGCK